MVKALLIKKDALKADPQLQPGARGARKHVVTEPFANERRADLVTWAPPPEGERCSVQEVENWEMATFTETAIQDNHWHEFGTEIYMVLEGTMIIRVDGVFYTLRAGDTIVVNPPTAHEVIAPSDHFLCRIITVNCDGPSDKFVVE